MNLKRWLIDSVSVFAVSLVVCLGVTFLWGLIVHRAGAVDWETAFRFAIMFAILMPWLAARRSRGR